MKKKYLILTLLFTRLLVLAQTPTIGWERCFGGSNSEEANEIITTSDGNYIVAGSSNSTDHDITNNHGYYDFWIVKVSNTGVKLWEKSYGGTNPDEARSIKQTSDGGYIVAGYSQSNNGDVSGNHGGKDFWVIKLSATGVLEWQKTYGGTTDDYAENIQLTSDGGFIVAGRAFSTNGDVTGNHGTYDYWVIKLSSAGVLEWQKALGGSGQDWAYSIKQTTDGGYIVGGSCNSTNGDITNSNGGFDYWIAKLSSTGVLQWQKSLGGVSDEYLTDIQLTPDGGYIVSGGSTSNESTFSDNHGLSDYLIIKLNSSGTTEWKKIYGGGDDDSAESIIPLSDGNYIIKGKARSNSGDVTGNHLSPNNDTWIIKIDNTGSLIWQKCFGGTGEEYSGNIVLTADNGFVFVSRTDTNNYSGDLSLYSSYGVRDYWVVKSNANALSIAFNELQPISLYPNPVSNQLNLVGSVSISKTAVIYDMLGKAITVDVINNTIDVSQLQNGVYTLELHDNDNHNYCNKFIKQ